jgi:hypothetical protein
MGCASRDALRAQRDLSIAYQISGEGDIDLVLAPVTTSHLDYQWKGPLRGWFEDVGVFCRWIPVPR